MSRASKIASLHRYVALGMGVNLQVVLEKGVRIGCGQLS